MHGRLQPDLYLETALSAISSGPECSSVLDEIPVPISVTDADGLVTYWNRACVEFAGREPTLGRDRWCVTWKLYSTTGEPLPHDQCPMADAIRRKRPVRDQIAIAERPDGSRVAFRPYPTPIFDDQGKLTGAVNALIDVSDEQSAALAKQADRCRRLAEATYDRNTSSALGAMARGFERTAQDLRSKSDA
jgi:PAS domain S-box-containing protein